MRISRNMTQAMFAETLDLSVEAIRNIEHQKYTPSAKTIDTICQKFNISPVDLLFPILPEDKKTMISAISDKLKDCELKELDSINTMIDVIRAIYRNR